VKALKGRKTLEKTKSLYPPLGGGKRLGNQKDRTNSYAETTSAEKQLRVEKRTIRDRKKGDSRGDGEVRRARLEGKA